MNLTPTQELINAITDKAKEQNLKFSRWQTNSKRHGKVERITYALHTGERASQFRYQPEGSVVDYVYLNNLEGRTPRCEAYRKLARLANAVNL